MQQELPAPQSDEVQAKAIELLAAGNLTQQEIADQLGVDRSTLFRWRQDADFAARLDARVKEIGDEVRRIGIADRTRRIAALNDRWNRLRRIIEDRADDESMEGVPGGSTGLLARTLKGLGRGDDFTVVAEYAVDTGLLAELRAVEKQAAQELGQWSEKHEHSGSVTPLAIQVVNVIDRVYKESDAP